MRHLQDQSQLRVKEHAQAEQFDWDKCAFCQVHTNERLLSVMTFKMSKQIIEISKYHLSCFSACI